MSRYIIPWGDLVNSGIVNFSDEEKENMLFDFTNEEIVKRFTRRCFKNAPEFIQGMN